MHVRMMHVMNSRQKVNIESQIIERLDIQLMLTEAISLSHNLAWGFLKILYSYIVTGYILCNTTPIYLFYHPYHSDSSLCQVPYHIRRMIASAEIHESRDSFGLTTGISA